MSKATSLPQHHDGMKRVVTRQTHIAELAVTVGLHHDRSHHSGPGVDIDFLIWGSMTCRTPLQSPKQHVPLLFACFENAVQDFPTGSLDKADQTLRLMSLSLLCQRVRFINEKAVKLTRLSPESSAESAESDEEVAAVPEPQRVRTF